MKSSLLLLTPAKIVTGSVKSDVQRVEVSCLPVEELQKVEVDQPSINNGAQTESIQLDGGDCKIKDQ